MQRWIVPCTIKVKLATIPWPRHFPIVKSGTDGQREKGRDARGCFYQSHSHLRAHSLPKARAQHAQQWAHLMGKYWWCMKNGPVLQHKGL